MNMNRWMPPLSSTPPAEHARDERLPCPSALCAGSLKVPSIVWEYIESGRDLSMLRKIHGLHQPLPFYCPTCERWWDVHPSRYEGTETHARLVAAVGAEVLS